MSWNACTWHELADLTFNGPSTNLLDQSPDGQKLITQVATENVVDWVYSKTQIFLATLSTQNQPRGKSSLFSEVEHSFPSVGCARSKRQCLTVLQNQKLFRWMLVWEWTGPPALDLWDVVTEVLRSSKSTESPTRGAAGKCSRNHTSKPKQKGTEILINCHMWTTLPQTQILLKASLSCTSLKITKQWSKLSSKAEVQRSDTCQEPTELRLIGYLTKSIWTPKSKSNMLTPKTNSRTMLTKGTLHVMNGIIFCVCLTSWIFRSFPAAIFFQTESRGWCPWNLRKARLKRFRQWRKRDRWIWCQGTSRAQRKSSARFERFEQPGESRVGSEFCVMEHQEIGARQRPRPNNTFSRVATRWQSNLGPQETGAERWVCKFREHQETGAEWWQSNRKDKVEIPQYADLRPTVYWESLQEPATKVESRRKGTSTRLEDNSLDLGILYVDNDESLCSSWIKLQWKFWKDTGTSTSNSSRICSISRKDWFWNMKPTRLHRFRLMHGKDARSFRSKPKMERSTRRISTVQFLPRIVWNRWRTVWLRVEYFPRSYANGNLPEDPKRSARSKYWTWTFFRGRIIMSMFNGIDWTKRENSDNCISNSEQGKNYVKRFSRGHWSFQGPGDEEKWYGTHTYKIEGKWDSIATEMLDMSKLDTQYSRASVLCVMEFRKETVIEHIKLVSHNSLSKWAQSLRSSIKLVWRDCSVDSVSNWVDHGKSVAKENEQRLKKKNVKAARSEFFGTNSKEQRWGIWKQIVRTTSEI